MTELQHPLIYETINKVMADVEYIGKERKNTQQNYNFRGIDDIYNSLHSLFAKHKLFYIINELEVKQEERTNKNGTVMMYATVKVEYRFMATDGSNLSYIMFGEGSDTGDKAINKARSSALKYCLMQMFLIPTEEEKDTEINTPEFTAKMIDRLNASTSYNDLQKVWQTELQNQANLQEAYKRKVNSFKADVIRDFSHKIERCKSHKELAGVLALLPQDFRKELQGSYDKKFQDLRTEMDAKTFETILQYVKEGKIDSVKSALPKYILNETQQKEIDEAITAKTTIAQ